MNQLATNVNPKLDPRISKLHYTEQAYPRRLTNDNDIDRGLAVINLTEAQHAPSKNGSGNFYLVKSHKTKRDFLRIDWVRNLHIGKTNANKLFEFIDNLSRIKPDQIKGAIIITNNDNYSTIARNFQRADVEILDPSNLEKKYNEIEFSKTDSSFTDTSMLELNKALQLARWRLLQDNITRDSGTTE